MPSRPNVSKKREELNCVPLSVVSVKFSSRLPEGRQVGHPSPSDDLGAGPFDLEGSGFRANLDRNWNYEDHLEPAMRGAALRAIKIAAVTSILCLAVPFLALGQ